MGRREKERIQSGGETVRTFVCIEMPDLIRERIAQLQASLKSIDARVSWVKPENIHLTLKFLGDVPASRMAGVCQAVSRAASSSGPFAVEVSGNGCFPAARNPRVLWVGLSDLPEELLCLHRQIEDQLAGEGFPRDAKRFAPHLTIGRVRSPESAREVALALMERGFEAAFVPVSRIVVMRSDLHPSGSLYTPQALIELPKRG